MADPLSILGAVETCFSLAKEIWGFAEDVKNQQSDHAELDLNYEYDTIFLQKFIEFFKAYQNNIADHIRRYMVRLTAALNVKLAELKSKLVKRAEGNLKDRALWHFVKSGMITTEADLAKWLSKFNMVLSNLPEQLRQPLLESFTSADYGTRINPLSPLVAAEEMRKILKTMSTDDQMGLWLENLRDDKLAVGGKGYFDPDIAVVPKYFWHDEEYSKQIHEQVAKLVAMLSHAETDKMHILKAYKYFAKKTTVEGKEVTLRYGIVYQKPKEINAVITLKQLIKKPTQFSLTQRIRVAADIASAIAYIHAIGWVHELIRSEHVLLCYNLDALTIDEGHFGVVKICGFDASREVAGQNVSRGQDDGNWEHELYCHPDRQQKTMSDAAEHPSQVKRFRQKHDVYSLGVVLLELGLWQDLETFPTKGDAQRPLFQLAQPDDRKVNLGKLADDLAPRVGDIYKQLVVKAIGVKEHEITAMQIWSELDILRV